ncbi:class I SAM-dependent methyltransferase [Rhizobium sp. No.120]
MTIVNRQPYKLAIKALDVATSHRVLELGFGAGRSLAALCRLAPKGKVFAIDHSEAMLAMARRKNRRYITSGQLELHAQSFSPLTFADNSFDRILLVNVIYFFDQAGHDVVECHRVLRPGGRIVIYATDKETMRRWPFCEDRTHRIFGSAEAVEMLVGAGFQKSDIGVEQVALPLGVRGFVLTALKH